MSAEVMAIGQWRNNGELIKSCAELGYLRKEWLTLDPTYGLGRFWKEWQPSRLVASDINPAKSPIGHSVDFTELTQEFGYGQFDAITYDAPYKYVGTSAHASDEAYGVNTTGISWQARDRLIIRGLEQCIAVLKDGGFLLAKGQSQVVSGRVHWQVRMIADHAESLGCRLVDMLHLPSYRPQPAGRTQKHARRNYSTLLVLKKERA